MHTIDYKRIIKLIINSKGEDNCTFDYSYYQKINQFTFYFEYIKLEDSDMRNYNDIDQHFTGTFNIRGEEISGELIHNRENGVTWLNLIKKLPDKVAFGENYGNLDIITGVLNTGATVTLFHNRCTMNRTQAFSTQQLYYIADYTVWSKTVTTDKKYNELVCEIENALAWSQLSVIDTSDFPSIKFKGLKDENTYSWFGAKISFYTSLKNDLFASPRKEDAKVVERLVVSIKSDEKQDASYFIALRNKIISLISFSIKDNVNIEEQYLHDYEDKDQLDDLTIYFKHYLFTSERRLSIHGGNIWDFNFTLSQVKPELDLEEELTLLEPIFNLYLSLFKYNDMPHEMVFLNVVQALETFHSRFFYEDSKDKYVESVISRFGNFPNYPDIEKLLLCDTQKDENCPYIILVSRLNDLLIGNYDGLFYDFYVTDKGFAQTVADTRHYYTHYGKSKEKKALKGDMLIEVIHILSLLLEYSICLKLGIDNQVKTRERLSTIASWKEFQIHYQKANQQTN